MPGDINLPLGKGFPGGYLYWPNFQECQPVGEPGPPATFAVSAGPGLNSFRLLQACLAATTPSPKGPTFLRYRGDPSRTPGVRWPAPLEARLRLPAICFRSRARLKERGANSRP